MKKTEDIDVFLISFPKCGRTWLRLMLGMAIAKHFNLEHPDLISAIVDLQPLARLHPDIPKICVTHDDKPLWKKAVMLNESKEEYKNAKVIFLVRDPKDAIVSSYFQKTKRYVGKKHGAYEGELSAYIREEVGSLDSLLAFYNIWAANRHIPKDFLLVRYEDMHVNIQKELQRTLSFIGLNNISDDIIKEAIKFASFDNMRRMEEEGKLAVRLQPGDSKDPESYKTRKGKVGGYTEYLTQDDIEYINQRMREGFSKAAVELYSY